jgi:hypothetical protein
MGIGTSGFLGILGRLVSILTHVETLG